jgi:hypothetical protein
MFRNPGDTAIIRFGERIGDFASTQNRSARAVVAIDCKWYGLGLSEP